MNGKDSLGLIHQGESRAERVLRGGEKTAEHRSLILILQLMLSGIMDVSSIAEGGGNVFTFNLLSDTLEHLMPN